MNWLRGMSEGMMVENVKQSKKELLKRSMRSMKNILIFFNSQIGQSLKIWTVLFLLKLLFNKT